MTGTALHGHTLATCLVHDGERVVLLGLLPGEEVGRIPGIDHARVQGQFGVGQAPFFGRSGLPRHTVEARTVLPNVVLDHAKRQLRRRDGVVDFLDGGGGLVQRHRDLAGALVDFDGDVLQRIGGVVAVSGKARQGKATDGKVSTTSRAFATAGKVGRWAEGRKQGKIEQMKEPTEK